MTVARTHPVSQTGSLLRVFVIRFVLTCGFTLVAWVLASAVSEASTTGNHLVDSDAAVTSTSDMTAFQQAGFELATSFHQDALAFGDKEMVDSPTTYSSERQTPLVVSQPNQSPSESGVSTLTTTSRPYSVATFSGQASGISGDKVWTGSASVQIPDNTPAPDIKAPAQPLTSQTNSTQTASTSFQVKSATEKQEQYSATGQASSSQGSNREPTIPALLTPQTQLALSPSPISSPSGLSGHDGNAPSGVAGIIPPQNELRPSAKFLIEEHNALRISEGVPGLPSTSPD